MKYSVPQSDITGITNNSPSLPQNWNNYESFDRHVNYLMDGVGNRTLINDNGAETAYLPNCVNEYHSVGGAQYRYDKNGNLIWDWSRLMSYDNTNRLAQVALPGGAKFRCRYDTFGRRVAIDSFSGEAPTGATLFFYDGQQIILEISNTATYTYIYGIGIDEPIVRYEGLTALYYHSNSLGSVVALTDDSGALIESIEYDVYGLPAVTVEPGKTATGNRYLFTGREWDSETGLYHYRARAYNPQIGRFLQRDQVVYDVLLNLYTYVQNDPTDRVDPFGLVDITSFAGLNADGELDLKTLGKLNLSLGCTFVMNEGIDVPEGDCCVTCNISGSAEASLVPGGVIRLYGGGTSNFMVCSNSGYRVSGLAVTIGIKVVPPSPSNKVGGEAYGEITFRGSTNNEYIDVTWAAGAVVWISLPWFDVKAGGEVGGEIGKFNLDTFANAIKKLAAPEKNCKSGGGSGGQRCGGGGYYPVHSVPRPVTPLDPAIRSG